MQPWVLAEGFERIERSEIEPYGLAWRSYEMGSERGNAPSPRFNSLLQE